MPQGQGAGTRQAVDETAAFDVFDINALGALERQGSLPREQAQAQASLAVKLATVDLYRALGGGWDGAPAPPQ